MTDKFCIHYYDDETGEAFDAYSSDSEIETLVSPFADEVVTERSRFYDAFGDYGEKRLYVFSPDRGAQLREICHRFFDRIDWMIYDCCEVVNPGRGDTRDMIPERYRLSNS